MSAVIGNFPVFKPIPKNTPLPKWLVQFLSQTHWSGYKDLLIPDVQFKVVARDTFGGVNIGITINGKDIYGNILVFPYTWQQSLTTSDLFMAFEGKLSRHLNMIKKGSSRGNPQQLKALIDSTFQVNCKICPKAKRVNPSTITLTVNSKGQVVNQKGKVVGMSGTIFATALAKGQNPMKYAKSLSKKKKKAFNPSVRN